MDVRGLAAAQGDVVAGWQLREIGWAPKAVQRRLERGWRVVHPGVYALTQAPLTRHQLWMAATLSAPGTALAAASAGAWWGFRPGRARSRWWCGKAAAGRGVWAGCW